MKFVVFQIPLGEIGETLLAANPGQAQFIDAGLLPAVMALEIQPLFVSHGWNFPAAEMAVMP